MLIACVAVSVGWQGKGIGGFLLEHAMLRTLSTADIAGIRALAVHAKDDLARAFYEHFEFAAITERSVAFVRAHQGPRPYFLLTGRPRACAARRLPY